MKLELIDRQSWATRAQVRPAVFEFIEVFYNRKRLHSSLNFLTPVEYEATRVPPEQGRSGGIIRLSGEPGQPQTGE